MITASDIAAVRALMRDARALYTGTDDMYRLFALRAILVQSVAHTDVFAAMRLSEAHSADEYFAATQSLCDAAERGERPTPSRDQWSAWCYVCQSARIMGDAFDTLTARYFTRPTEKV